MKQIPRAYKEVIRYIILVVIFLVTYELSKLAYTLEEQGKLTLQFAGVVASSWGAITLILKYFFTTKVSE